MAQSPQIITVISDGDNIEINKLERNVAFKRIETSGTRRDSIDLAHRIHVELRDNRDFRLTNFLIYKVDLVSEPILFENENNVFFSVVRFRFFVGRLTFVEIEEP